MKATLATAIMLQLAGGMPASKLDLTVATASMSGETPDAEAQTLLMAQAIGVEAALKEGQATAVSAALAPVTTELNTLKATHGVLSAEAGALRTTNTALTSQVQTLEAAVASSEKVLRGSISSMCVALGATDASDKLKGAELSAEHSRLETEFVKKFPSGKVAAVTLEGKANEGKPADPKNVPMFARLAAAASV